MKVKVDTLIGPALDWAVAQAEYTDRRVEMHDTSNAPQVESQPGKGDRYGIGWFSFRPSTDWSQGGPIIEREKIDVMWCGIEWCAYCMTPDGERQLETSGPTPLSAAMRAYVASKMGDKIEVPEELK
jgi:hypothetical protein